MVGYVYKSDGSALSDVTVTTAGTSAATNDQGWFAFPSLEANSALVVTLSKTGYISSAKTVSIVVGRQTYFAAGLLAAATSGTTITNSAGGTVIVGTTIVASFPANAFVDSNNNPVSGNVTVKITPGSFASSTEADAFPGQYQGVDATGATISFESFGWANISATDASGNGVNIGTTKTWTLSSINPTGVSPETTSIPLWYFANNQWNAVVNPATSAQISATYIATRDSFTASITGGNVSNTPWNLDRPWRASAAYIKGKVVDYNGSGVDAANVQIRSTANNWLITATTGSDGTWGPIAIPGNRACRVIAIKGAKASSSESVAALSSTTYTQSNAYAVANITVDSPRLLFTLTWGANPSDLDSHLTMPKETSSSTYRYHLYYSNRSSTSSSAYPFANLDTDDTSSYGPEHTTVYRLQEGTYRFCVHHYTGSSDIENSNALVGLNVDDGLGNIATYSFTPPTGQTSDKNVWEVCDIAVNSSGKITSVTTLGTYGDASKATYDPNGDADQVYTSSVKPMMVK